jgi:hypothetical protein
LRKNLRWSDGRPVKTEEFVSGFRHALSPRTPSRLAPLIFNIKKWVQQSLLYIGLILIIQSLLDLNHLTI